MKINFKEQYKKSIKYLIDSQNFIAFMFVLILFFFIIGILFPVFFKEQIISFFLSLEDQIISLNPIELILFIFNNNIKSSFFILILGTFIGVFPLIMIAVNGYMIGFILHYAIYSSGIFIIWKLFPHGIFEFPAVLISAGLGLRLGYDLVFNFVSKNKKTNSFRKNIFESLKTFVLIILPLLIIAAIIEGLLMFLLK